MFCDKRVDLPETNMFRYMRNDIAKMPPNWRVAVEIRTASEIESARKAAK